MRGYKVWAIVSPWTRLKEMVDAFLIAKQKAETLRAWVNLTRGESWEEQTQKVESSSLLLRREEYRAEVPAGVGFLTAGIDTQDDRLEVLVLGWGSAEECWVVMRETVVGDPQMPETWKALDELLLRGFPHEAGGVTHVQCALIDCLGHRTQDVYAAVRARQHRRLYASIGRSGGSAGQLVSMPAPLETKQGNVMRCVVDADQVKSLVYSRLRLEAREGSDVIHFPMTVGELFFSELTSEHLITERNKYGVPSKKWAKRPGHDRNESLDCFGMAFAAMRVVAPTKPRYAELVAKVTETRERAGAGTPTVAHVKASRTRGWTS